jgi:hypothetical protein
MCFIVEEALGYYKTYKASETAEIKDDIHVYSSYKDKLHLFLNSDDDTSNSSSKKTPPPPTTTVNMLIIVLQQHDLLRTLNH